MSFFEHHSLSSAVRSSGSRASLPNGHQKFLGCKRINWFCEESSTLLDRVMSTRPALPAGELCCTFTCDLRGKGEYRIGLVLKEKTGGENVSFGEAILDTAGWRTRTPAQESPRPMIWRLRQLFS
jgi:hypothetical protein